MRRNTLPWFLKEMEGREEAWSLAICLLILAMIRDPGSWREKNRDLDLDTSLVDVRCPQYGRAMFAESPRKGRGRSGFGFVFILALAEALALNRIQDEQKQKTAADREVRSPSACLLFPEFKMEQGRLWKPHENPKKNQTKPRTHVKNRI
jgi:hypothetical protein